MDHPLDTNHDNAVGNGGSAASQEEERVQGQEESATPSESQPIPKAQDSKETQPQHDANATVEGTLQGNATARVPEEESSAAVLVSTTLKQQDDDDASMTNDEMIAMATAAALRAAEQSHVQSDSILSVDYDDDDEEDEEDNNNDVEKLSRQASIMYMENSSMEILENDNSERSGTSNRARTKKTRIVPSGRPIDDESVPRTSTISSLSSSGNDGGETDFFQQVAVEKEAELRQRNEPTPEKPVEPQDVDGATESKPDATTCGNVTESVLQSCGVLPLSCEDLGRLYHQGALRATLFKLRKNNSTKMTQAADNDSEQATAQRNGNMDKEEILDDEALMLYSLFSTFCAPSPSLDQVRSILRMERSQRTSIPKSDVQVQGDHDLHTEQHVLPKDVLVNMSGKPKSGIVSLLRRDVSNHLLRLNKRFQLAFFRILIRLLTNETNDEYNEECLMTIDWWQSPTSIVTKTTRRRSNNVDQEKSAREKRQSISTRQLTHQLYSIVRFRCGAEWSSSYHTKGNRTGKSKNKSTFSWPNISTNLNFGQHSAVTALLELLEVILEERIDSAGSNDHLLAPVIRLLGLVATAGVSVKELRRILSLIHRPMRPSAASGDDSEIGGPSVFVPAIAKLMLVRALSTAAEGAGASTLLVGKTTSHPEHFFTFGRGSGLVRHLKSLSTWPFKNDFGMAVWFRAESFVGTTASPEEGSPKYPMLLSFMTQDGGGIEVSLLSPEETTTTTDATDESNAAVLAVTVRDSNAPDQTHRVVLKGCVLLPKVWYHVAVRHSRSRLQGVFSLSTRQQISIMLDGKVMLTEELKFPEIADSYQVSGMSSSSKLLSSTLLRSSKPSKSDSILNVAATFGSDFDGQTGSLYVFNDHVSETTLRALFVATGGTGGAVKRESNFDNVWDSSRGAVAKRVTEEMTKADTEELVVTRAESGAAAGSFKHQFGGDILAQVFDLSKDENQEDNDTPQELSKSALGSKLFLVWDPRRTEGSVVFELHSGAHVNIDLDKIQPWFVDGPKQVIASIGSVQAILPLFRTLLAGDIERDWRDNAAQASSSDTERERSIEEVITYTMVPNLLRLLSSFLRSHAKNARETLRCGGVDIVEQTLLTNKTNDVVYISSGDHSTNGGKPKKRRRTLMSVLSCCPALAHRLVDSLLDLRVACAHNVGLETKILSRLLFNVPLWFSGANQSPGVVLHAVLLPRLSEIAKSSPQKIRDCVGVRDMIESLREYTTVGETLDEVKKFTNESRTVVFDRSCSSGLQESDLLTICERRHVIDILLGMVMTVMAAGTLPSHLSCFLSYISFNLDQDWEKDSLELQGGNGQLLRQGSRAERYLTTNKACTILLFLLQGRPVVPNLFESLAECCGGTNGFAGWALCAMVNSFDDSIRSLGVRCLDAYLDVAAPTTESFLNLTMTETVADAVPALVHDGSIGSISPQVQKRAVEMLTHVGKGLAVIGSAGVLPGVIPPSKINVQIVFKLLWHLLKCHRTRIGEKTHAAAYHLLLDDQFTASLSLGFLLDGFVSPNDLLGVGYKLNSEWAGAFITEARSISSQNLRDSPGINTILRLLRFLPDEMKEKWLTQILELIAQSRSSLSLLVANPDWQPCLFLLISETLEEVQTQSVDVNGSSKHDSDSAQVKEMDVLSNGEHSENSAHHTQSVDTNDSDENARNAPSDAEQEETKMTDPVSLRASKHSLLQARYNLSLKLYATLLGHAVRQGGEKAFQAVETAASLQRICVNGDQVLSLVLSHLLSDLVDNGTMLKGDKLGTSTDRQEEDANPLKLSARIVTKSLLSNGTDDMDIASATRQWRCLRHLTALVVAVVTKSGFGVSDLFDYRNQSASAVDSYSDGLHGIRLPDDNVPGIAISACSKLPGDSNGDSSDQSRNERETSRHVCVTLATQLLLFLDAFVFSENLDVSLPASQLHGLALVRKTESRIGLAQGPLLASLVRVSLILLCHLEPISVKFLQCCSRLRCFLHWALELIRESVALAGYSAAFHDLTAPLDRLVLAIVLHSHRALSRCSAVLFQVEGSPYAMYFPNEKSQKKSCRRLFRVVFELREMVLAAYKGRNEVLKAALSLPAFDALQASLEKVPADQSHNERDAAVASDREATIRSFLESSWVAGFHDIDMCGNFAVPEQVSNGQVYGHRTSSHRGLLAIEELGLESKAIIEDFDRGLDMSFEAYCESQRQWAETDAVRDLEYQGDTTLKRLAGKHRGDSNESYRVGSLRLESMKSRWDAIDRNFSELWNFSAHWRLAEHTDRSNRRILLVRNRDFQDHQDASYELMLGRDREKADREREELLRRKQEEELSAVMRRNEAAFVPYNETEAEDGDEEQDMEDTDAAPRKDSEESEEENINAVPVTDDRADEDWDQLGTEEVAAAKENIDVDAWAKAFIWSESESIVARFDEVTVVTLRTLTDGKILVTTHGLYFHPTGDATNVMTKEPIVQSAVDRRWRLSRLTEVHGRRYMLRPQALELFFSDTHELFLDFKRGTRERDRFYAKLRNSCKVPMLWSPKSLNPKTVLKKSKITELWRRRKISNFQYLMNLNFIAGRSFNDISQYPVFPWVLSDYTSETLDLSDSRVFRDLSKPVGALNPDRLAQLIERYNELESFGFPEHEKFLYGSHYSSPGNVLHFLIRQEPFTSMAVELQSGRFDCPDRLFFDIAYSWNSCLTSSSDVKELTPEFFTCPEILLNTNNYPLGQTQNNREVHNVGLPPWANGSAYEFVRIHRLALESDYVSENLNKWIDLIFGYKQRGQEAEAAHNIFHYLSYEGSVDLDKISDEVDRKAAESHIQNFGQTPCQLLVKEPHPRRYAAKECWEPLINELSVPKQLRCHTPSRQFGGKRNGLARGPVLSIHIMTDTLVVVYSDLSIGTYKFSPWRSGGHLKMDKHRSLTRSELSTSRSVMKRGSTVPATIEGASDHVAVGNRSFVLTPGGFAMETLRRRIGTSRLNTTKDMGSVEASSLILSCGYWDNMVKVHSLEGLRLRCSEVGGHRGQILCLDIGNDGALMVTGGQDATCRVWVVDHPDMSVALSDGYVKTALGGSTADRKESTLTCCHVLWGHETAVNCLSVSSELDVTVSGSIGGTVCVHTLRRGTFVRSIRPVAVSGLAQKRRSAVRNLALDANGIFIAHMEDGGLHSYTVNGILLCSENARDTLHDMQLCSNGEVLVTGGDNGHVVVRTVRDLQIHSTLNLSRHGPVRCISLTPEELNPIPQFMFIGSDDGMITVVNKDPTAVEEGGAK